MDALDGRLWLASMAFILAACVTGLSIPLAHRLGILDQPGRIKIHSQATPRFGGVGIAVTLITVGAASGVLRGGALAGLIAIAVVGALDDRHGLRPIHKLLGEVLAGALLGWHLSHGELGGLGCAAGLIMVVALANAVNLVDGMNGLAAGSAAISAAGCAMLQHATGGDSSFALVLSPAALGFLIWNFPRAKTFMGDVGSLTIGYSLAYILASLAESSWRAAWCALPMVALPLSDMLVCIARRRLGRRSILEGDRDHLYDVLHRRLANATTTVLTIYGANLVLLVIGMRLLYAAVGEIIGLSVVTLLLLVFASVQFGLRPRGAPDSDHEFARTASRREEDLTGVSDAK